MLRGNTEDSVSHVPWVSKGVCDGFLSASEGAPNVLMTLMILQILTLIPCWLNLGTLLGLVAFLSGTGRSTPVFLFPAIFMNGVNLLHPLPVLSVRQPPSTLQHALPVASLLRMPFSALPGRQLLLHSLLVYMVPIYIYHSLLMNFAPPLLCDPSSLLAHSRFISIG